MSAKHAADGDSEALDVLSGSALLRDLLAYA
jgi:hypothetical protein